MATLDTVTLDNVHGFSVFELRKELERRGLALPSSINHNSLMQVIIQDLLREKELAEQAYAAKIEQEQTEMKRRMAAEKEQRKAAALERSRKRQEAQRLEAQAPRAAAETATTSAV